MNNRILQRSEESRRALLKGSLWAAPVVVSTCLVPAYAASVCPSYEKRFDASWTLENPVQGSLYSPKANKVYRGVDNVDYFISSTTANPGGIALVRYSTTISSGGEALGALRAGRTYSTQYGITSLPANAPNTLHPTMRVYLIDPQGNEVAASRSAYSTSSSPASGVLGVPLAPKNNRIITQRLQSPPFSFQAVEGEYRWIVEFEVPSRVSTNFLAAGIGVSAPIFICA
ncbi:hypothetical protein [Rothia sp. ZJ932]|uniref:hypothetical protein n=1 Tax=Rothia sp. ZJ932 TaxID=2810516 RepID=UPI001966F48B|nr:hypothetical protein [Rothia sp. ZJ932]QRZ61552.1 hypothetical protein JR346_10150 [Rothia sp. ZJ932]